ncbi:MAG: hypothetical protein KAJ14_05790, partial [Candidatus Omnitrophica bacterium]|nr:hypothetical protein [Candidatus Omnitrophota bacterium]
MNYKIQYCLFFLLVLVVGLVSPPVFAQVNLDFRSTELYKTNDSTKSMVRHIDGPNDLTKSMVRHIDVDGSDLAVFASMFQAPSYAEFAQAFGSTQGSETYNAACDFDVDGDVDGSDLAVFASMFQAPSY